MCSLAPQKIFSYKAAEVPEVNMKIAHSYLSNRAGTLILATLL
jgi:hypothetical protein